MLLAPAWASRYADALALAGKGATATFVPEGPLAVRLAGLLMIDALLLASPTSFHPDNHPGDRIPIFFLYRTTSRYKNIVL